MTHQEIKYRLQFYIGDNNFTTDEKVDMCFQELKEYGEQGFNAAREMEKVDTFPFRNEAYETFEDYLKSNP